jgi:hypothetical protein
MALGAFGPGIVIVTRTDTTTPLSVNIGYAQEFSFSAKGSTKKLYGQNQFPLLAARGTVAATGKVKAAMLSGLSWNAAFFGNAFTAGKDNYYFNETHTVASTTQVVTNATGGIVDLGVSYAASGLPLQRVASAPAVGQYAVNTTTGTYTLNVTDEVALNFSYSNFSSASGQQLNVVNQLIGTNPTFQLDYWTNLNQPASKPFAVRAFACVASDLSFASKLEDFVMPELSFDVFANAAGQVFNINFPEVS